MIGDVLDRWSSILARSPGTVLVIMLVLFGVLALGGQHVGTAQQNTEDFLPDRFPVIDAFNTISAEFGSAEATSYTVLIQTDPSYADSNEIRDVRDPRLLRYIETVSNDLRRLDRVTSVSGPSSLFSKTPPSRAETEAALNAIGEGRWSQFISDDYSAVRMTVEAAGISASEELAVAEQIQSTVKAHDRPPGLALTYTGQPFIDKAFQNQSNETMGMTTMVAILGVLIIVIILFRSLYYGLNSILTVVFGIVAGFGVFGYLGFNISPATSGAIAIGIGIGVDFGIQTVSRYIEEREHRGIDKSIQITLGGVARPMTLGCIAALLGFSSLSFGTITFLSSLGYILSLTTAFAFVAAFTVVPPLIILYDRYVTEDIRGSVLARWFDR